MIIKCYRELNFSTITSVNLIMITAFISHGHFDATLKFPEGTYMLSAIISVYLQWYNYLSSNGQFW